MTMINDIRKGITLGFVAVGAVTTGALVSDLAKKVARKADRKQSNISELARKEYGRKILDHKIKVNDLADRLAKLKYSGASEAEVTEAENDLKSAIEYADYDQARFEEEFSKELGLTKYSVRTVLQYRQRREDALQAEIDYIQDKIAEILKDNRNGGNRKAISMLTAYNNMLKIAIVNKANKMAEFDEYWEQYLNIHKKAESAFVNYNGGEK